MQMIWTEYWQDYGLTEEQIINLSGRVLPRGMFMYQVVETIIDPAGKPHTSRNICFGSDSAEALDNHLSILSQTCSGCEVSGEVESRELSREESQIIINTIRDTAARRPG